MGRVIRGNKVIYIQLKERVNKEVFTKQDNITELDNQNIETQILQKDTVILEV